MEIREYAHQILVAEDFESKLAAPPANMTDESSGSGEAPSSPNRSSALEIRPGREVKVPPPSGLGDPAQRPRILHALANHELQAVELFAWALLKFPSTPVGFRRGLLRLIEDEQRHARAYVERLESLGHRFGDFPLSGHFWRQLDHFDSPLKFVARMGLVFESANLDFGFEYLEAAKRSGDEETHRVVESVHRDEVGHVAFAWRWFLHFKDPSLSDWEAYAEALGDVKVAARARGAFFDREGRLNAGVDAAFVDRQAELEPRTPGGHRR